MYIQNNKCQINIYLLTHSLSWQNLPWQKIRLRVSMIMKQIYLAAKKNNLTRVYDLQNYLINCVDTKVLSINRILEDIYYCYNKSNKTKIIVQSFSKFQLLQYLSDSNVIFDKLYISIAKKIRQYMIRIVIEPIWKARVSKDFIKFNSQLMFHKKYRHYYTNIVKYLLGKTVETKLICYNYLEKTIKKFVYSDIHYLLDEKKNYDYINQFFIMEDTSLNNLLNYIILDNTYWHIFSSIKNDSIVNNERVDTNEEKRISKVFYILTRYILYRKTIKSFRVIDTFNSSNNILNKIRILYKYSYDNIAMRINIDVQEHFNTLINVYVDQWVQKHISTKFFVSDHINNAKLTNSLLNRFAFLSNMFKVYTSLFI